MHLTFLQGSAPKESTGYALWKATEKIKQVKEPALSCIPQKMNPKKKHLQNLWRPHINSIHQSTISKDMKFKKSSTA
jgi:hypothetical protein